MILVDLNQVLISNYMAQTRGQKPPNIDMFRHMPILEHSERASREKECRYDDFRDVCLKANVFLKVVFAFEKLT